MTLTYILLHQVLQSKLRDVGEGLQGQPALGSRTFFRKADRSRGCPTGGMGGTVSDTGSGSVVAALAG